MTDLVGNAEIEYKIQHAWTDALMMILAYTIILTQ